jgi:hypothetical protein
MPYSSIRPVPSIQMNELYFPKHSQGDSVGRF